MPSDTGDIVNTTDTASDIVVRGALEMGIALPDNAAAKFGAYFDLLDKRRRSVNLTAITGEEEVARLHFLDSLALLNAAAFQGASLIDIGSGAGFPGVPLKIAEPSIDLTLLDATGKRITFLSELCELLSIKAEFTNARAEDAAFDPQKRAQYDIAVSRAVARLNMLCELCLPFVRIGGLFIAMKSVDSADELFDARNAISTLGGEHLESYDYLIPGTEITHRAIIIKKMSDTLDAFPRRFSKIQKTPL